MSLNLFPPSSSLSFISEGGLSGALKFANFEKLFWAAEGNLFNFSIYSLVSFILKFLII
jgi:hypothetical protein